MSDLPLPRLMPDDPENLLSTEARQRVSRALLEYERIRKRARSAIELRGYWGMPQGSIDLREADMDAARTVLRVEAEEYAKLGLSHQKFREIMRMRIDSMIYSLELSSMQRDMLEAELLWPSSQQDPEHKPNSIERSAAEKPKHIVSPSGAARVAAYMTSHGLTQVDFAVQAGISERTVGRLLAGEPISKAKLADMAALMNITLEELLKIGQ